VISGAKLKGPAADEDEPVVVVKSSLGLDSLVALPLELEDTILEAGEVIIND
jgi:hypothetical protein